MQTWEYALLYHLSVERTSNGVTGGFAFHTEQEIRVWLADPPLTVLNQVGREGWIMISTSPSAPALRDGRAEATILPLVRQVEPTVSRVLVQAPPFILRRPLP